MATPGKVMRYCLVIWLSLLPATLDAAQINLLAASSLRELVHDAKARFEQQYPEHRVLVSTASSGTLARQVEAGAPADLFLSANPQWMHYLVEQEKVAAQRPVTWAANRLVIVGRGQKLTVLKDCNNFTRLAIASPESSPAGRYAKTMLDTAGLYTVLEDNHRLVFAKDVLQVLLYAEQGVVDGAIVYASDARLLKQAKVLLIPEEGQQPEIRYQVALTRHGDENPAAKALLALLVSTDGSQLLETYGLVPLLGIGD